MAQPAAVPVDDSHHLRHYGEGRAGPARERALPAPPHEVCEGGAEGGIGGARLPEPGTRPGERVNDGGDGGQLVVQTCRVVGMSYAVEARWSTLLVRMWAT